MLKFSVPTARQRGFAHAVVVALLLGAGYASWAAQPGAMRVQPSPTSSPTTHSDAQSIAGRQLASSSEKQAAADKPTTSIQAGEIQDISPSENITFRKMTPPKYPPDAAKALIGAKVIVKVLIDAQGNPKSAEIEKLQLDGEPKSAADGSAPDKPALEASFAEAAKAAVMSWKFNPGVKDGKPFEGYALVPLDFNTQGCKSTEKDPCPPSKKSAPTAATAKQGKHA